MIADTFFIKEETPENAGEMLIRLGMDGRAWAREFNKIAPTLGYSVMDEGWLIGWFCNSIMMGWDTQAQKHQKKVSDLQAMIDIQTSPGNADVNDYMRGMANGLLLAGSCFDIIDDIDSALIQATEDFSDQMMDVDTAYNEGIVEGKRRILEEMKFKTMNEINADYYDTKSLDVVSSFAIGDVIAVAWDDKYYTPNSQKYTVEDIATDGRLSVLWFDANENLHRANYQNPDWFVKVDMV